jgi:hypothetical protein
MIFSHTNFHRSTFITHRLSCIRNHFTKYALTTESYTRITSNVKIPADYIKTAISYNILNNVLETLINSEQLLGDNITFNMFWKAKLHGRLEVVRNIRDLLATICEFWVQTHAERLNVRSFQPGICHRSIASCVCKITIWFASREVYTCRHIPLMN